MLGSEVDSYHFHLTPSLCVWSLHVLHVFGEIWGTAQRHGWAPERLYPMPLAFEPKLLIQVRTEIFFTKLTFQPVLINI